MNKNEKNLLKQIDEYTDNERKKADILRTLLDHELDSPSNVLVTTSHMGAAISYLGTVSLRWIRERVKLFTQLPLFRGKVDEKGSFIIDESTVAELKQRAPNWARQPLLVYYLLRHSTRKFPPILVVVEEAWVNKPKAPEWGKDGRARKTSLPFIPLDSQKKVGLVPAEKLNIYVIDGSHRVIGIHGLLELISENKLTLKKRDGAPTGQVKELHTLLEEFELEHHAIADIEQETMGIEFIPAVLEGETREQARIRVRSVFVHVNKAAEPPTKGEQVLLDEDDGFSIITRDVALEHSLFRAVRSGDRVNWRSSALPAGSKWLTTGTTLRDMAEAYLGGHGVYSKWKASTKKEISVRPAESQLAQGKEAFKEYLDKFSELPSIKSVIESGGLDEWREFSNPTAPNAKGHLLMRPLGQLILAGVVGYLCVDHNGPGMALSSVFDKLQRFDKDGGFENVERPTSYWYGITYNPHRKTMSMEGRATAIALLRYLLGDDTLEVDDEKELLADFSEYRSFDTNKGRRAFNHDGREVPDGEVELPPRISSTPLGQEPSKAKKAKTKAARK